MSHVDEGTLHAWLDGALDTLPATEAARVREHLAHCEVCRARLEEERAIRQEAADILGAAVPGSLEAPEFEELRARATAGGRPRRVSARLYRLGWAASVVLALGAGWMLRDASVPDFGGDSLRSRAAAPAGPAAVNEEAQRASPAAPSTDTDAGETRAGAVGDVAGAAGAPAVQDARAERADASVPSTASGAQDVARRKADEEDRLDAPAAAPTAIRQAEEPTLTGTALLRDKMIVAPLPEARLDTMTFPRSALEAKEAVAAASAPRPTADTPVAGGLPPWSPLRRVAPAPPAAPTAVQSAASRPAAEAGASRNEVVSGAGLVYEDPAALRVPGLALISIDALDGEGLAGATRVRQRMTDGDTLEIVRLPVGLAPSALAPVRDGRTELVLPRDGGWLVVRARAERDTLLALVRRMGEGR